MTSLNDELAREVIRQSVNVARFEAQIAKTALSELVRLDKVLVGLLVQTGDATFKNLLSVAKKEINERLSAAKLAALRDSERLITAAASSTAASINVVTGAELATRYVAEELVQSALSKSIVMGAPASQWWTRQKASYYNKFSDTVRAGAITGRTTGQLITDWRQQSGQLMRHAEAQVRTSVQSMQNAAQMEVLSRNADLVKGVQALVTFDLRTSAICRSRSNDAWDFDGNPLNANTTERFPGPPPWHWNCRTVLTGVLKEFSDLDPSIQKKLPPATRSSMNGQVAEDLTYNDWLKTLPVEDQIEVLGKRKHELWKNGKLTMKDMVDQRGRELTIDQLELNLATQSRSEAIKKNNLRDIFGRDHELEVMGAVGMDGTYFHGDTPAKLEKRIHRELLKANAETDVEWSYVWDKDTGDFLLPMTRGTYTSVHPWDEVKFNDGMKLEASHRWSKAKNPTLVHVHPTKHVGPFSGSDDLFHGYSLSPGDWYSMHNNAHYGYGEKEVWAITNAGEQYIGNYVPVSKRPYKIKDSSLAAYMRNDLEVEFDKSVDRYHDLIEGAYTIDDPTKESYRDYATLLGTHRSNTMLDEIGVVKYRAKLPKEMQEMYDDTLEDMLAMEKEAGTVDFARKRLKSWAK